MTVYADPDGVAEGRYGGCYVVQVLGRWLLAGEDYRYCNCNGDRADAVLAKGDSPEELRLFAAAAGLGMEDELRVEKRFRYPPTHFPEGSVSDDAV